MKTLANIAELGIAVPNVEITRTSLCVTENATERDYLRLEQMLEAVGGSSLWWWGDYLNHLASARGIEYAEAKAASSYAPETLKKAAWVCRHVAPERRRGAPLTFGHHIEIAGLSPTDQEIWLDRAEDEKWTTKQLRAEIRKSKAVVQNGPEQSPEDSRAANAWASFEQFSMWFRIAAPDFTGAQWRESGDSIRPVLVEYLRHASDEEVETLLRVRSAIPESALA